MTSIRWPRFILDRFKHKQRTVKRVSQGYSASGCASQICDYSGLSNGLASNAGDYSGRYKANINQAQNVTEAWGNLKNNDWPAGFSGNRKTVGHQQYGAATNALNIIGHFDPPSFRGRLSRACRAFVNAWRLP